MFLQCESKNPTPFDPHKKCRINVTNRFAKKKLSQIYLIHIIAQRIEASQIKDCCDGVSASNVYSRSNTDLEHDEVLKSTGVEHPLLKKNSMINMMTPFYYGNSTNDLISMDQNQMTKSCYSSSSSSLIMSHPPDLIQSDLALPRGNPIHDVIPWNKIQETQCLNKIYRRSKINEKEKYEAVKVKTFHVGSKVKDILGVGKSMSNVEKRSRRPSADTLKTSEHNSPNETAKHVASTERQSTVSYQEPSPRAASLPRRASSHTSQVMTASENRRSTSSIQRSCSSDNLSEIIDAKMERKRKFSKTLDNKEISKKRVIQDGRKKQKGGTSDQKSTTKSKYDSERDSSESQTPTDQVQYKRIQQESSNQRPSQKLSLSNKQPPNSKPQLAFHQSSSSNQMHVGKTQDKNFAMCLDTCLDGKQKIFIDFKESLHDYNDNLFDNDLKNNYSPTVKQKSQDGYSKTKHKSMSNNEHNYGPKEKDRNKANIQSPDSEHRKVLSEKYKSEEEKFSNANKKHQREDLHDAKKQDNPQTKRKRVDNNGNDYDTKENNKNKANSQTPDLDPKKGVSSKNQKVDLHDDNTRDFQKEKSKKDSITEDTISKYKTRRKSTDRLKSESDKKFEKENPDSKESTKQEIKMKCCEFRDNDLYDKQRKRYLSIDGCDQDRPKKLKPCRDNFAPNAKPEDTKTDRKSIPKKVYENKMKKDDRDNLAPNSGQEDSKTNRKNIPHKVDENEMKKDDLDNLAPKDKSKHTKTNGKNIPQKVDESEMKKADRDTLAPNNRPEDTKTNGKEILQKVDGNEIKKAYRDNLAPNDRPEDAKTNEKNIPQKVDESEMKKAYRDTLAPNNRPEDTKTNGKKILQKVDENEIKKAYRDNLAPSDRPEDKKTNGKKSPQNFDENEAMKTDSDNLTPNARLEDTKPDRKNILQKVDEHEIKNVLSELDCLSDEMKSLCTNTDSELNKSKNDKTLNKNNDSDTSSLTDNETQNKNSNRQDNKSDQKSKVIKSNSDTSNLTDNDTQNKNSNRQDTNSNRKSKVVESNSDTSDMTDSETQNKNSNRHDNKSDQKSNSDTSNLTDNDTQNKNSNRQDTNSNRKGSVIEAVLGELKSLSDEIRSLCSNTDSESNESENDKSVNEKNYSDTSDMINNDTQNKNFNEQDTKSDKKSKGPDYNLYHTHKRSDTQWEEFQRSKQYENNKLSKQKTKSIDRNRKSSSKSSTERKHDNGIKLICHDDHQIGVLTLDNDSTQENNTSMHRKLKSHPKELLLNKQRAIRSNSNDHLQQKKKITSDNRHEKQDEKDYESKYKYSDREYKKQTHQNKRNAESKELVYQEYISDDKSEEIHKPEELKNEKRPSRHRNFETNPVTITTQNIEPLKENKLKRQERDLLKSKVDDEDGKYSKSRKPEKYNEPHYQEKNAPQYRKKHEMERTKMKATEIEEDDKYSKQRRHKSNKENIEESYQDSEYSNVSVSKKKRNTHFTQNRRQNNEEENHHIQDFQNSSDVSDDFEMKEKKKNTCQSKNRNSKLDNIITDNNQKQPQKHSHKNKDMKIKSESQEKLNEEHVSNESLKEMTKQKHNLNKKQIHVREKRSDVIHQNYSSVEDEMNDLGDSQEDLKLKLNTSRHSSNLEESDYNSTDEEEKSIPKQIKPDKRNKNSVKKTFYLLNNEVVDKRRKNRYEKNNDQDSLSKDVPCNKNSEKYNESQESDIEVYETYGNENNIGRSKRHNTSASCKKDIKSSTDEEKSNEKDYEITDSTEYSNKTNNTTEDTDIIEELEENNQQEDWVDCDDDIKSEYYDTDSKRSDDTPMDIDQCINYTWQNPYRSDLVENIYRGAMHRLNPTIEQVKIETDKKNFCKNDKKSKEHWKADRYRERKDGCEKKCEEEEEESSSDEDCETKVKEEPYKQKSIPFKHDAPQGESDPDAVCTNSDDAQFLKYNTIREMTRKKFQKQCAKKRALDTKYEMKCKAKQEECASSDIAIKREKKGGKPKICLGREKEKNVYHLKEASKNRSESGKSKNKSKKRKAHEDDEDEENCIDACLNDKYFRPCKDGNPKPCDDDKEDEVEELSIHTDPDKWKLKVEGICRGASRDLGIPSSGWFLKNGVLYHDGKTIGEGVKFKNGVFKQGRKVLLEGVCLENGIYYKDQQPVGERDRDAYRKQFVDVPPPGKKPYVNPLVDPEITPRLRHRNLKKEKAKTKTVRYPIARSGTSITYRAKTITYRQALKKHKSKQKSTEEEESSDSRPTKISFDKSADVASKKKHKKDKKDTKSKKEKKEEKVEEVKEVKEVKKTKEAKLNKKAKKEKQLAANRKRIAEKCKEIEKELAEREKAAYEAARKRPIKSGILLKIDPPCDECMVEPHTGDVVLSKVMKSWIGPLYTPNTPC